MFGLGLIKGLSVTMRHFIESYIYDRKPWETQRYNEEWLEKHQAIDGKGLFTIQYPEQKRKITENFRFIPMLVYEETPGRAALHGLRHLRPGVPTPVHLDPAGHRRQGAAQGPARRLLDRRHHLHVLWLLRRVLPL